MGVRRCQSAYEAPSDETPTVSIWFPRQPEWRQGGAWVKDGGRRKESWPRLTNAAM